MAATRVVSNHSRGISAMVQATRLSLLATTLLHALAVQVPLESSERWQGEHHPAIAIFDHKDLAEWNLDLLPNPNATDHLVFETVHSLLQHWPNTRMRNGHTIVPATIPQGTLLYHGRRDNELPTGPEWLATDPEHSYLFCWNYLDRSQHGGWHLTLMATRPLKMVYFDGSSAAKLTDGSVDTQHLLWGRVGDVFDDQVERFQDLCKWGKKFGVDGFVRMEMDFEIIFCDFTSGVSVVSFTKLATAWKGRPINWGREMFEVMNAGAWHNHFPGETRIQLDLPGLVSFYDAKLAPSLVPIRGGQERWDHRTLNVSQEDLSAVKSRLEANLIRPGDASSGIDWETLLQVIVDRYAQRLELIRYLLNSTATHPDDTLDLAKKTQTQLRIMLTPYLLFSATPSNPSDETELDWTLPIFKLCATAHTYSMEDRFESMTDSERLILQAIRGTSREICRVVTKMWAAGVCAGIDPSLNTKASPDIAEVTRLRADWAQGLERLMAWLDWSVWIKCNPGCGFEEVCYLPTWPVGFPWLQKDPVVVPLPSDDLWQHPEKETTTNVHWRTLLTKRLAGEVSNVIRPEPDEWIRPQPKCIRRVRPYTY